MKLLVVVGQGHLELVGSLVGLTPSLLTVTLLLRHALVLLADLPVVSGLPGSVLVFEHATHAEDGLLLRGPVHLLLAISSGLGSVLSDLLVGPVTLILSVEPHSILVH